MSSRCPVYFESWAGLWGEINPDQLPRHVAIIMDGNGRWARRQGWERIKGHELARESVRESIRSCGELGIEALSLFAFSVENWSRPRAEVEFLFRLFERTLTEETPDLKNNNVRLRILGDRTELPDWLNKKIDESVEMLSRNTGLILSLAVNYGGQQDILQALTSLRESKVQGPKSKVTKEEFGEYLMTKGLPDVDLMIRTSGEMRISNFFLWQAAYAELVFMDVMWPDFRRQHILEAVVEFQKRERRMGSIGSKL